MISGLIRKLAFLAFAICAACAAEPRHVATPVEYTNHSPEPGQTLYVPVYADASFSDDLRHRLRNALWHWNRALNGHFKFVVADLAVTDLEDNAEVRRRIDLLDNGIEFVPSGFNPDNAGTLGIVRGDDLHVIHLNSDAESEADMSVVIMHEMGHALGLDHNHVLGSLLYPIYSNQAPCVDETTVQVLAAQNGWDYRHLNWCAP